MIGGAWHGKTVGSKKCTLEADLKQNLKKKCSINKRRVGAKSSTGKGKLTGTISSDSSQLGILDFMKWKSRLGPGNSLGSSSGLIKADQTRKSSSVFDCTLNNIVCDQELSNKA